MSAVLASPTAPMRNPRTAGWLAHWVELLEQDQKIARPRQLFVGYDKRDYVPIEARG